MRSKSTEGLGAGSRSWGGEVVRQKKSWGPSLEIVLASASMSRSRVAAAGTVAEAVIGPRGVGKTRALQG